MWTLPAIHIEISSDQFRNIRPSVHYNLDMVQLLRQEAHTFEESLLGRV